ncbi:Multidrug resistance protein [Neocucurbitaria cava]|uniref:Multidrug resistance protein n=1 Tax=Neocucurbitaria cava TaxID=798079 RepID=A0A9W8YBA0_9PLEO|nr:Multidrug resistance protein [Neocucurbitaria cava]
MATIETASRSRNPIDLEIRSAENAPEEEVAASLGLTTALDTKVGNDFVQGLSGGERKRTTIAVKAPLILSSYTSN